MLQLISQLDRRRYSPRLLVFKSSEYIEQQQFPCPVTVLGVSSLASPSMWWLLLRFARQQYSQGVRIAHVYFNDASVVGPPVFWLAGIKTIISRRDMGYWYTPVYRAVLRLTRHFVAMAVVNSQAVGEVTSQVEGITGDKLRVVYNGYMPRQANHSVIPELESIAASQQLVAGLVANIRPIKRMQDAIAAVAKLRREGVYMQLVIVGGGDSSGLERLAAESGVDDSVWFLGARSDVQQCLAYFDVALLCSESEGFSNALVEYQYAGLPVICTRTGGNPEAIVEGITGLLYEVGDVDGLAAQLKCLVENDQLRQKMGEDAQSSASQRFSVKKMVEEHEKLYDGLLGFKQDWQKAEAELDR